MPRGAHKRGTNRMAWCMTHEPKALFLFPFRQEAVVIVIVWRHVSIEIYIFGILTSRAIKW